MTPSLLARCAALLFAVTLLLAACTRDSVPADLTSSPSLTTHFLGEGGGRVVVSTPDMNSTDYETNFTQRFAPGTELTLSAVADESSVFEGWNGDCGGAANCQLTVDGAKTVTATFSERGFTLTVQRQGTGTGGVRVLENGAEVATCRDTCEVPLALGSVATLEAAPDGGVTFTSWDGDCSGTALCQLTVDAPKRVTAVFDTAGDPAAHTLTVGRAGSGSGRVTSNPVGIDCGSNCEGGFAVGSTVLLTARENAGSVFVGWQNCPSPAGNSCSTPLNADGSVTAVFNRGNGPEKKIVVPIRAPSDDAEQYLSAVNRVPREKGPERYENFPANAVDIKSGDLDLTYNTDYVDTDQLVGLRFTNLGIPPQATILDARIQFTIDHETSGYVRVSIYGQENPQASTFVHQGVGDISNRPRTNAVAVWEPPAWLSKEGTRRDPAALTPNLAAIVQEVNDLPGWQRSDNGLVFVIQGDPLNGINRRRATSFEDSDTESQLIVTYLDQ